MFPNGYAGVRILDGRCVKVSVCNTIEKVCFVVEAEGVEFSADSPNDAVNQFIKHFCNFDSSLAQQPPPSAFASVKFPHSIANGPHFFGLLYPPIALAIQSRATPFGFSSNQGRIELTRVNRSGCARSEAFDRFRRQRNAHQLSFNHFASSTSRTVSQKSSISTSTDFTLSSHSLPVSTKMRQLSSNQHLFKVIKSGIHGWGLYTVNALESDEMIIEYVGREHALVVNVLMMLGSVGEVIGSRVADLREKRYEKRGLDMYMFRLDRSTIVDATLMGNKARFINHSCDPNCTSRIIAHDGRKHIVIVSGAKAIGKGEELTYDYKLSSDDDVKIKCYCCADNCRLTMN